MTITINPLDGCIYRTWLRLMLGITASTAAMRDADELYRRHPDAIRRVAQTLSRELLPRVWPDRHRTLYRGLRLAAPDLDGRSLPPHPSYDVLPALSFSESLEVAAHFADPGALGMPAFGRLPPHGYIGTAQIDRDEVLFHWRYLAAIEWLAVGTTQEDLETVLWQREVLVRNRPELSVSLSAFAHAGARYIASTYPGGTWLPAAAR